jgi:hypothetical protein
MVLNNCALNMVLFIQIWYMLIVNALVLIELNYSVLATFR